MEEPIVPYKSQLLTVFFPFSSRAVEVNTVKISSWDIFARQQHQAEFLPLYFIICLKATDICSDGQGEKKAWGIWAKFSTT